MSRIGQLPIQIPSGVTITVADDAITVVGPKGQLEVPHLSDVIVSLEEGNAIVTRKNDERIAKAQHGLQRALLNNAVVGVTEAFVKKLEVNGVGYRAQKQGKKLVLSLGYSHPVEMEDPEGIETVLDGTNIIIVKGISKEAVGQYAAEIRAKRAPEPYKGKGIKYADEVIRRKVGKTGKK